MSVETIGYRRRRTTELLMVLLGVSLGVGGWFLTGMNQTGHVSPRWGWTLAGWGAMAVAMHVIVRWRAPYADPLILPCVIALNGLGLAMIHRIDLIANQRYAWAQLGWTAIGMALFAATLIWLRDVRRLERFPYLLFLTGLTLLMLPMLPGLGVTKFGSTIWIRIGRFSFQPSEAAKVVLAIAFAGYLVNRREVLSQSGPRLGPIRLPRLRDMGPILIMWAASMLVIVVQNDLGTALLFFGMFVMMLYVATERVGWVVLGAGLFGAGAWLASRLAGHVQTRVDAWLHPFDNPEQSYQVIQAQYGFAWGGLSGRGWGLGRPGLTPLSRSDFIAGAFGEELGIIGLSAIVMIYGFIIFRGLKASLVVPDAFSKLLASGMSFVFALQVFAIIGGVTRLLPLTGLTTPFLSQGGSSMVSNWAVVAILILVSHLARQPRLTGTGSRRPIPVADLGDEMTRVI